MLTYRQFSKMNPTKAYTNDQIVREGGKFVHDDTIWANGFIALYEPTPTIKIKSEYTDATLTESHLALFKEMVDGATAEAYPVAVWGGQDWPFAFARVWTKDGSHCVNAQFLAALLKRNPQAQLYVNREKFCLVAKANGQPVGILMLMSSDRSRYESKFEGKDRDWILRNEETPLNPYTDHCITKWEGEGVYYTDYCNVWDTPKERRAACLQVAVNGQSVPLNPIPEPVTPEPEPIAEVAPEPVTVAPVQEPEPQPVAIIIPELSKVDRLAIALAGMGVTEVYTDRGKARAVWAWIAPSAQPALWQTIASALREAAITAQIRSRANSLYVTF